VSISYVFLTQFWYHIAITVLVVAIYLVTRLAGAFRLGAAIRQ
jgi:hypothetical protein